MRTNKVTCDQCEPDLTTTGNSVGYRIVLKSEHIQPVDGAVTDMYWEPDFPEPLHFCGYRCLSAWAKDHLLNEWE